MEQPSGKKEIRMWTCNLRKIEAYHVHQHSADNTICKLAFVILPKPRR